MMIIQHRANDHMNQRKASFAEVDVWVCDDGRLRLKHDVKGDAGCAPPITVETFLLNAPWDKFFVNIKQSLSIEDYWRIEAAFENRLIGLFDIPMPAAYRLSAHATCPIYERVSEYEGGLRTGYVWLDPLDGHEYDNYWNASRPPKIRASDKVIIACPSLHGEGINECRKLWSFLKLNGLWAEPTGIVTKFPEQAAEVLGD
jgi:hypothetical protein